MRHKRRQIALALALAGALAAPAFGQVPAVGPDVCVGANCGSSPVPSGPTRRPREPSPAERAAEQEAREAERERQRQAEQAERQQRELVAARQRIAGDILRLGSSPAIVNPAAPVVTPAGTTFFRRGAGSAVSLVAPLITRRDATPATAIPVERLRRAAAIMRSIRDQHDPHEFDDPSSTNGAEEIAFLAGQAALALEGAPLQVVVQDSAVPPADARQFAATIDRLAAGDRAYAQAREHRIAVERQLRQSSPTSTTAGDIARQLMEARSAERSAKGAADALAREVYLGGRRVQ